MEIIKQIFINAGIIIYFVVSFFIFGMAILLPFTFGSKDYNLITCLIIYPAALILAASQNIILNKFNDLWK